MSSIKIKTPVMPEPFGYFCEWRAHVGMPNSQEMYYGEPGNGIDDDWNCHPDIHKNLPTFTADQLAVRDAQWLEMVGPLVEALDQIAGYSLSQFKNAPDMAAQCVDDAAKALSAITKE